LIFVASAGDPNIEKADVTCAEVVPQHSRTTVRRQEREASRQKSVQSILGKIFLGQRQHCAFFTRLISEQVKYGIINGVTPCLPELMEWQATIHQSEPIAM